MRFCNEPWDEDVAHVSLKGDHSLHFGLCKWFFKTTLKLENHYKIKNKGQYLDPYEDHTLKRPKPKNIFKYENYKSAKS